jgi:hypothetical protein
MAPHRKRTGQRFARMATAGVLLAAGITATMATSAHADSIGAFIGLPNPAIIWSQSQPYTWTSTTVHLSWQRDGNLVLYCNSDTSDPNKVLWATGTDYTNPVDIVFGGPYGLIAVRDDWDTVVKAGWQIAFEAPAGGINPGDYAYVQNDGNFVIYPKGGGHALWATGTNGKC